MSNIIGRRQIADGVYISTVTDSRYKSNYISVCFYNELDENTATENVIVPSIISKSNTAYPTYKLLKNRLSALYGAAISATSGRKYDLQFNGLTAYFLDDIYALSGERVAEEMTDLLIGCLLSPVTENGVFPEKTVELEKLTVIDDIKSVINDKRAYAVNKAISLMCKGEPMAVTPYGTVERAEKLTGEISYKAYKRLIENTHCEIVCVGCNDFKLVAKKLEDAFAKVNRNNVNDYSMKLSPIKSETETEIERLTVNQSKMVLGFKTHSEDKAAIQMLQKIYGGTTTSKLFMNVRERMSLCYYCSASYNDVKGIMTVDCGVENDTVEKAKAEIIHQLEEIKNGNFTDEDISFAELSVMNGYKSIGDSVYVVADWYIDHIIKNNIEAPLDALKRYIGVSRERIIAAAQSMELDSVYILTSTDNEL